MTVYTLLIINKAGGLIYNRDFTPGPNPHGTAQKISTNEYLVLAGTFHGVHAITKSLTPRIPVSNSTTAAGAAGTSNPSSRSSSLTRGPNTTLQPTSGAVLSPGQPGDTRTLTQPPNPLVPMSGLESLESSYFRLSCFQTHTGTKFLLITDPLMPNVDAVMKGVYERYADHVMKNPFYQLEMPVRVEGWDRAVGGWLVGK